MPIIIKGDDFEISVTNGTSAQYDLDLISRSPKAKNPVVKSYYGCSFKSVLQRISKHRMEKNHPDPFTDVRDYMTSLMGEERKLIDEIEAKIKKD